MADTNSELIATYCALRDDWRAVYKVLRDHQNRHSVEHYYEMRSRRCKKSHTAAARFIYLNRTCWNGLYRVNFKGRFNVPKGTKDTVLLETDNFASIAAQLRKATIIQGDFESVMEQAAAGDFVFIDPP